jgi:multisubunit Na+/H+ antiporter MnhC subunit
LQVLFLSFTLIILLMIGTFYVVLQSGAIRLNGV